MKRDRKLEKRPLFVSSLGFRMWLTFTILAALITLLFWFFLSASVRINYENENLEELDRTIWTAVAESRNEGFAEQMKLVAETQNCYIELLSEGADKAVFIQQPETEEEMSSFPVTLPEDLFEQLDANKGNYSFRVNHQGESSVWAVQAIVTANIDNSRQVLVIAKSMIQVDHLVLLLRKRVLFALFMAIGIASVLSLLLTRFFAGPIRRLTDRAQELATGNFDISFPQEGYYEVKQLSETMEIAAREFQATEQIRRDFIANVTHDMKTPLTVIKMYTEMIQTVSGDQPEKREEHLERIQAETDKLSEMINGTLDLARLQSRTIEIKMKEFDLSNLIRSTVASCAPQSEEEFAFDLDLEENLIVYADRKQIARVLQNFISNAMKFSLDEKRIRIRSVHRGDCIRTEVTDYGPGIAPDDIKYVWNRYYTVNPYGNNKFGTGLGLNIVSEIMEIHEMEYGVESTLGEGSTFWFDLKAV